MTTTKPGTLRRFLALAALLPVALAGCATDAPLPSTPSPETSTSADPDPELSPTAEPVYESEFPLLDRCQSDQGYVMADDAIVNDQLRMSPFLNMRDLGATEHAAGEVTLNDEGGLAFYVVAEGDTQYAILTRFCMDSIMLEALNVVRRAPGWLAGDIDGISQLYAGDTLNLDPHTITSVGDENGVVYNNTPTFELPPQREG